MRAYKILLFLSLFIVISNSLVLDYCKNKEDLWWFVKEIESNYKIVEIKWNKRKLLRLIKLRIKRRLFLIKIIRNIILIILTLILLRLTSKENPLFLCYLFIFTTIKIELKEFESRTVLYSNKFIEILEILTKEGKKYYSITYKKDTVTIIDSNDLLSRDYEIVRLHESRSLELKKIIRETEIGSCFGISRQRTSHKCAKYKKGGRERTFKMLWPV